MISLTTSASRTEATNAVAETMSQTLIPQPSILPDDLTRSAALELELKKHPFFHGRLTKEEANARLTQDGQYLVRFAKDRSDGQVKAVISARWNGKHCHFVVREKFGLFSVADAQFESIDSLLQFHERKKQPLTKKSGALIAEPIILWKPSKENNLIPYVLKFFAIASVVFVLRISMLMNT
ncbi:hypothetical protein QR680_006061 [Steinernema hermaphroditum]|uniref:SH2 domain-containing protein n=1 Tax=Steinernema hermaphroditum TaxID=289476 RepID=A0AA39HU54_9BILA|nr:hypothetical protein QR680_006061 [Steinernema hermaphroditum]